MSGLSHSGIISRWMQIAAVICGATTALLSYEIEMVHILKETISQIDLCLVTMSSKTYVF